MANPDFSSFTKEALLTILNELGVSFPGQNTMQVSELAQMVSDTEVAVGEKVFAEAVAKAQGLDVVPSASQQTATQTTVNRRAPSARSLNPGTSTRLSSFPGLGLVYSETWNPPTPLEYGRTVA